MRWRWAAAAVTVLSLRALAAEGLFTGSGPTGQATPTEHLSGTAEEASPDAGSASSATPTDGLLQSLSDAETKLAEGANIEPTLAEALPKLDSAWAEAKRQGHDREAKLLAEAGTALRAARRAVLRRDTAAATQALSLANDLLRQARDAAVAG